MIITIDGHAGSGKSLAAINLAKELNVRLLNTGAMYRAAAIALKLAGINIDAKHRDVATIERIVQGFHFEMPGEETVLNGVNVTAIIGSEEAGRAASRVGTFPEVRTRLKAEQRRLAAGQSMICEGRDQGTAVFPEAPLKFFFTASVEVRTRRRIDQLLEMQVAFDPDDIARQVIARDRQDEERAIDPLKRAPDAIVIDTSAMSPEEVLQRMLAAVAQCPSPA